MSDPVEVLGKFILLALVGVFLAHQVWSRKAGQRQSTSLCVRCGKEPASQLPPELYGRAHMCANCQRISQRNYRAGSWFFYSLAILFGISFVILILPDMKDGVDQSAAEVIGIFISVTGLCAGAGFCIRFFGKKVI